MTPARKTLQVHLSDESYEGLREWVDRNGLTMSGFIQAIAEVLIVKPKEIPQIDLTPVVMRGRRIDAERRKRK